MKTPDDVRMSAVLKDDLRMVWAMLKLAFRRRRHARLLAFRTAPPADTTPNQ